MDTEAMMDLIGQIVTIGLGITIVLVVIVGIAYAMKEEEPR